MQYGQSGHDTFLVVELIVGLIIVIGSAIYCLGIRPSKCQKILEEYARTKKGHLVKALKIDIHSDLYRVSIEIDGQLVKSLVRFDFKYNMTWL